MDSIYDLAVVGGGASGMAAAVSAGLLGDHVALLEASPRLGRKLLASGNGRCNLMNAGDYRYYGDASFAASVLSHAGSEDIRSLMSRLGVILTEGDDEGRVYPVTGQAATVTDALKNGLRMVSAHVETGAPVTQCVYKQDGFHIFGTGLSCVPNGCWSPQADRLRPVWGEQIPVSVSCPPSAIALYLRIPHLCR